MSREKMWAAGPDSEMVMVVDEHNRPCEPRPRWYMRRHNLRHRATFILVFHPDGRIFIHQRTFGKDVFPGYFDVTVGGVVNAHEEWDSAAQRETGEELGILDVEVQYLFAFQYPPQDPRVFGRAYTCTHQGPFRLQKEEIVRGTFLSIDEAAALTQSRPFTPDGLLVFRRYCREFC